MSSDEERDQQKLTENIVRMFTGAADTYNCNYESYLDNKYKDFVQYLKTTCMYDSVLSRTIMNSSLTSEKKDIVRNQFLAKYPEMKYPFGWTLVIPSSMHQQFKAWQMDKEKDNEEYKRLKQQLKNHIFYFSLANTDSQVKELPVINANGVVVVINKSGNTFTIQGSTEKCELDDKFKTLTGSVCIATCKQVLQYEGKLMKDLQKEAREHKREEKKGKLKKTIKASGFVTQDMSEEMMIFLNIFLLPHIIIEHKRSKLAGWNHYAMYHKSSIKAIIYILNEIKTDTVLYNRAKKLCTPFVYASLVKILTLPIQETGVTTLLFQKADLKDKLITRIFDDSIGDDYMQQWKLLVSKTQQQTHSNETKKLIEKFDELYKITNPQLTLMSQYKLQLQQLLNTVYLNMLRDDMNINAKDDEIYSQRLALQMFSTDCIAAICQELSPMNQLLSGDVCNNIMIYIARIAFACNYDDQIEQQYYGIFDVVFPYQGNKETRNMYLNFLLYDALAGYVPNSNDQWYDQYMYSFNEMGK